MKHSRNMVYKPTETTTELYLYAVNTGELYRRYTRDVIKNLNRYFRKGLFDRDKAIDAFYPVATIAAKMYCKEYASVNAYGYIFTVTDRFTVACDMVDRYMEHIERGI